MQLNLSDREISEILGAELSENDVINMKMEEAYTVIRKLNDKENSNNRKRRGRNLWKRTLIGFGSAAAILALTFVFCAMNPVAAREIPILGSLFAKVADVFPFGHLPEEDTVILYEDNGENSDENEDGNAFAEDTSLYQQTDGDLTVTLTEEYVSNQALFIGIRIENTQEFPEMAAYVDSGAQWMQVRIHENYSFRPDDPIYTRRQIEGKFEDEHTFIGILRIDYSEIAVDSRRYGKAIEEAEQKGEEPPALTGLTEDEWLDHYEIPSSFTMEIEITHIVGTLKEATPFPEDLEKRPGFPNEYQHWFREGSWAFHIPITQTDGESKVIEIHETNSDGSIGIESIELSKVEMTINAIMNTDEGLCIEVFDADNRVIEGVGRDTHRAIAGHDISTVSIYICNFGEWADAREKYDEPGNTKSMKELIEECALFKTTVKF